jgi:hypothetical protein
MLPIRWILAPVTLVFAIALLPRAFVAVGLPTPEKRASESPAQSKLQDRFIPGSDQHDQLMSPPEPAHYLTVASGNSQGESDLTGTVPPNDTPLAAKFPVDVSILNAQAKPAKQEDRQISATRSKVRRFSQIKADNHRPTQIRSVGNNADQGSGLIPTPNFTSSAY